MPHDHNRIVYLTLDHNNNLRTGVRNDPNAEPYVTLEYATRRAAEAHEQATIRVDTFINALKDLLND